MTDSGLLWDVLYVTGLIHEGVLWLLEKGIEPCGFELNDTPFSCVCHTDEDSCCLM